MSCWTPLATPTNSRNSRTKHLGELPVEPTQAARTMAMATVVWTVLVLTIRRQHSKECRDQAVAWTAASPAIAVFPVSKIWLLGLTKSAQAISSIQSFVIGG